MISPLIAPPRIAGVASVILVLSLLPGAWVLQPSDSSQDPENVRVIRAVADAVLRDSLFCFVDRNSGRVFDAPSHAPETADLRLGSRYNDWRYWNGVLNIGMRRCGEVLGDSVYISFSRRNIEFAFDSYRSFERRYSGQPKWNYPFAQRFRMEELDDCGAMGASVIDVLRMDDQRRYREYIAETANHIRKRQHRLQDGTLVRSFPRRWTLWADDLYMSVPFLARMAVFSGLMEYFDDAARQVVNFHRHLFNRERGLMAHYWYSDTVCAVLPFWGRANGWALMAQVELLDRLPAEHSMRDTLLRLLQRHIDGIVQVQDDSGLWHQLLDRPDSYLETSCAAMFTYAIARSVIKGYIPRRYAAAARRGWEGVRSRIRPDGEIEGVCTGTVVHDDLAYYYRQPAPLNDVHGIGAVLLAGAEVSALALTVPADLRKEKR